MVLHLREDGVRDEEQARMIAGAEGMSGRNIDYLRNMVLHLREDGVRDHGLERLLKEVEELEGAGV